MIRNSIRTVSAFAMAAVALSPAFGADGADLNGDAIVVTGSRSDKGVSIDRLGASVTVLDAETLQNRQTRVISDILRDVPGIEVSRTGAVGGLTQIRMRGGEGNHTLVLIDGIKASDPFQGEFDFGGLIADDVARIEIIRGQQSALYGSDAIGGVIHYITASGRDKPGYSARVEYGSQNTAAASARAAGIAGAFDYAVTTSYNRTDGYPVAVGGVRDIGAKTFAASGKFGLILADNLRLSAVGRYTRTDADTTASSNTTYAPIDGTNNYSNRSFMGLLRAELDLLDGRWTHAATAQINDNRRMSFGGDTGDTRTSANRGQRVKASYDTTLKLGEESAQHVITLAADFEREEFRNLPPATPQPLSNTRGVDNKGLVAEYRFSAGDMFSIGGAIRRDYNDLFKDATTYRASGSLKVLEPIRLRAAYGTGIKNPTPFELFGFSNSATVFTGNPNLLPEKSRGWEVGADVTSLDGKLRFGVTYFDARLKNEIYSARSGTASTPGNRVTDSLQHGFELTLAAQVVETVKINAAYTHLNAKENGVEEIRRAPDIASLNIDWAPIQTVNITTTVRYNGRTYDSNFTLLPGYGSRVRLDEFTLVNLNADWQITPQVKLFGRVENLFDVDYTEVFGFRTQGRTASVGVRATL